MKRVALLVVVLALLVAACGDDTVFVTTSGPSTTETVDSTTSTTAPPTSSTEPPTSSVPESTTSSSTTTTTTAATTTTASGPYYEVNPADFFPDPFPGSANAHGSGCVTPDLLTLPNGVWYGFVEGIGGGNLTFDLACFFTGTAACDAQIEDGEASTPADCLDFHIRNKNPVTFSVPTAPGWRVWYVDMLSGDVSSPTEIPASSWPSPDSFQDCPGNHCSVWLYVNGGRVTALVEQYLP